MERLTGLQGLESVEGSFQIVNTGISDVDALGSLHTIGRDLRIRDNPTLTSLSGLGNLTSIGQSRTDGGDSFIFLQRNLELPQCLVREFGNFFAEANLDTNVELREFENNEEAVCE